ncbi:MAG: hypothetical protein NTY42_13265 [Planctomycetota bacterium]|nr:hypothetical protein [Planctomycetota bacterium]
MDYESNLIDAREEGRKEGGAIGMEKGRIQLLQELLGGPAWPLTLWPKKTTACSRQQATPPETVFPWINSGVAIHSFYLPETIFWTS